MATIINSFALSGIDGYIVKIETDTIYGQPSVNIVGLGDKAVKEAKERLEAAIVNSNFHFPRMKIVFNLSPGDMKKSGSHFDLAMAIGLLIQSKQITAEETACFGFIGELSLNADLRPCNGILPMVIAAKNNGINNIIVPKRNLEEASLVKGINVFGFDTLNDVIAFLDGTEGYELPFPMLRKTSVDSQNLLDFSDVKGQDSIIEFIVAAASGGHNILMTGSPGCGKSMIAKRIPTILPFMTEEEALEVTKIYSIAGLLKNRNALITQRPFRSPHHNASMNSMVGGGNNALPGEISLAHNGVLFMDEIAEFNRRTLDSLRQPLEDGVVTISRVKYTNTYPANFMLVAAMNPCACGYYGTDICKCSDNEVLKYREKISGPILDRIDIQKYVNPVDFLDISDNYQGVSSKVLKQRVEAARNVQRERFKNFDMCCNAEMNAGHIKIFCQLEDESKKLLQNAFDHFHFSARAYHKYLKVARTFADLDSSKKIRKIDIAKSLLSRDLDKDAANMISLEIG